MSHALRSRQRRCVGGCSNNLAELRIDNVGMVVRNKKARMLTLSGSGCSGWLTLGNIQRKLDTVANPGHSKGKRVVLWTAHMDAHRRVVGNSQSLRRYPMTCSRKHARMSLWSERRRAVVPAPSCGDGQDRIG
jgi:hypothetical protein